MVEKDDLNDVVNRLHRYLQIVAKRPGGDVELTRLQEKMQHEGSME
jgi:hypothetical protein